MAAGLTDDGLEIPTLDELNTGLEDDIHGAVSPTLNLGSTSAIGEYKGLTASQLRVLWEALQALEAGWDPATATGAAQDRLGRLVGVNRRGATKSTVRMTLALDADTYAPGVLVVSKIGDPSARFQNRDAVVTSGGTVTDVPFIAQDTGPVSAGAGQLSVIANPIVGFFSATNPSDALIGQLRESNAAYRRRRDLELARKGSTTVDAIRADLLEAKDESAEPLFDYVSVIENDTDNTVNGRPPHSFESLVVTGADSSDIAQAIFDAKPAGIRAYGTTTATATDSQGNTHTVGWSVPTDVLVYISVLVQAIAGQYPGDAVIKQAVFDYFELVQTVGADVIHSQYIRVVAGEPGVVDVNIAIGITASPETEANYVIASREIARADLTRITVTTAYVPGAP